MRQAFNTLLGEGFRVFFLMAGLFGLGAMLLWEIHLAVQAAGGAMAEMPFAMTTHMWHAHELVFGFGAAAMAGFLLTAVPNWTGAGAARRHYIAVAAGVWLLGRLAVGGSAGIAPGLVAAIDLAFAPFLAAKIAAQLLRRPKPQNMVFLLFVLLFWVGNLVVHLDWMGLVSGMAERGVRAGMLALLGMVMVLGGRITPAFTRNAMHRAGIETGLPRDPAIFTPLSIALAALLPLVALGLPDTGLAALVMAAGGLVMIARVGLWHTRFQWREPILWTLHVSYGLAGLGLVLMAGAQIGLVSEVAALHLLAIGGLGGMILSVMSRATLGHTGRPLIAPWGVALGFALLPVAAVLRAVGSALSGGAYFPTVLAAGAIWCLVFALFVVSFWRSLWTPRPARG
ncbi:NnrS family protein [Actibacterium sp. XHP0104]|uniref:NnrS family protein n=1 Tax=Actibacterium sp. XHP0104 TaxID=2984335 RepID=UPI0021E90AA5|nr:NnrS family protein [Actibacterium sp. XHP0104]MCV2881266.1 NnrS family protein [Actibacterium sp. XHP0104]